MTCSDLHTPTRSTPSLRDRTPNLSNRLPVTPKLFILKPSFPDPQAGPGPFFCPHSATVEGLLAFYPTLRDKLHISYLDFPRPRHAVIAELGEPNQACPVLILPPDWPSPPRSARTANSRAYFVGADEIARFLSHWAGIALPHP